MASVDRSWPIVTATTAASAASEPAGAADGAQKRKRLEVDPDQLDAGLFAGGRIAVDRLAVRGDDENAAVDLAGLVDGLAQDVIVEDRLVEGNRNGLVCAEPNRVLELPVVLDAGDLEGANADAVRRDAEADAAARKRRAS